MDIDALPERAREAVLALFVSKHERRFLETRYLATQDAMGRKMEMEIVVAAELRALDWLFVASAPTSTLVLPAK